MYGLASQAAEKCLKGVILREAMNLSLFQVRWNESGLVAKDFRIFTKRLFSPTVQPRP
jgi:hypothetical protein